jgi:tubulin--tyrosine ligase-like protein 12
VCQRYIAAPLLYRGRKFDLRVLVAVRAFAPRVHALTWHETFVRAANHAYTAAPDALGDFQTQFTSMRQARAKTRCAFACA